MLTELKTSPAGQSVSPYKAKPASGKDDQASGFLMVLGIIAYTRVSWRQDSLSQAALKKNKKYRVLKSMVHFFAAYIVWVLPTVLERLQK